MASADVSNSSTPGKGAKYCDRFVCMFVLLSVRLHISKIARPIFIEFSEHMLSVL